MSDTMSNFWSEYLLADELGKRELLKKTLFKDMHLAVIILNKKDPDLAQHHIYSMVQSYLDDLIDYMEKMK